MDEMDENIERFRNWFLESVVSKLDNVGAMTSATPEILDLLKENGSEWQPLTNLVNYKKCEPDLTLERYFDLVGNKDLKEIMGLVECPDAEKGSCFTMYLLTLLGLEEYQLVTSLDDIPYITSTLSEFTANLYSMCLAASEFKQNGKFEKYTFTFFPLTV